ncbi:hypothetical protein OIV83_000128 [Microbotryomycetes sp. JL201]|nr:hypothetical protein OIV83_000128 [Microbotryomycetes sp. JL201]
MSSSAASDSARRERPEPASMRPSAIAPSSSRTRIPATLSVLQAGAGSSASTSMSVSVYATSLRSRHSLYGTEDRIVLDLGSSVWKVGFSGEAAPRACLSVRALLGALPGHSDNERQLWTLDQNEPGPLVWKIRENRTKRCLRRVWHDILMVDSRSRKVVIVDTALQSVKIKEMIARILFENLQVPSISYAPACVLSSMACGTVTGLVVECGNLETSIVPVFASRPMFQSMLSTTRAGQKLARRLGSLLLLFGSYAKPPSTLNSSARPTISRIPPEVLSDDLLQEMVSRLCYVGNADRETFEAVLEPERMLVDDEVDELLDRDATFLRRYEKRYAVSSAASTIAFPIPNFGKPAATGGVGRGWIQVPGWVRERTAEVIFESGDEDELSLVELILECLNNLSIDLRKVMVSNMIVSGGTAMLPGFLPRLDDALRTALAEAHPVSPPPSPLPESERAETLSHARTTRRLSAFRSRSRFAALAPLEPHVAILNNPASHPTDGHQNEKSGMAPAFAPALLPWIGGSLVGALKSGGVELFREAWDSLAEQTSVTGFIPDWTRPVECV